MPVVASDMKWYLSGGSGNTNPNASLGGEISATEVVTNTLANLFDNVSAVEAAAGDVEYRCAYLKNTHGTDTLNAVKLWVESNTPSSGTIIAIALDPAGITNGVSPPAVVASPLDENSPPPGVDFNLSPLPVDQASAITIGNMVAGSCIAVWFRRTVTAGAAAAAHDASTYRIEGTPV